MYIFLVTWAENNKVYKHNQALSNDCISIIYRGFRLWFDLLSVSFIKLWCFSL